ncbi:MAG: hypothetical protein K0S65_676 [Labilithrix sp.]|nr:hypothetical protein [Labilithrix sp.]
MKQRDREQRSTVSTGMRKSAAIVLAIAALTPTRSATVGGEPA